MVILTGILTWQRINLENRRNTEKSNNNIHINERNKLERELNDLKLDYSNKINENTNTVNDLTDRNNDIIIRKNNMKNISFNNAKAIEPNGYSKSLLVESFDANCPYSGSGSGSGRGSGSGSGSGSDSGSGSGLGRRSGDGSEIIYDAVPYYTVDLQNKKNKASDTTTDSLSKQYKLIIDQNNTLLQRQQYINDQFTRNNSKYENYSNYISNLNNFKNILFYLYYILIVMLIFKLFFNTPEWSTYYKIFVIIVLIIFPLIAYTIEKLIYNTWIFTYSFLSGNVYNNISYSNKVVLNNTTDLTTKE
jgi:hypothetical protein